MNRRRGRKKGTHNNYKANLVLVTFDQWRGDWGNAIEPVIYLPNMKELAKHGWTAQRCYANSPQCVPARLSWLTGLAPSQLGVTKNRPVNLSGNEPSFIRDLKNEGWTTGLVGKTHWTDHTNECDLKDNRKILKKLGFDYSIEIAGPRALKKVECEIRKDWRKDGYFEKQMEDLDKRYKYGRSECSWQVRSTILPDYLYPDIWIAEKSLKMIEEMPLNKPWILWISFVGPHEPFDTPQHWNQDYKNIPNAQTNNGWIERLPNTSGTKKIQEIWKGKLKPDKISALRIDYANHLRLLDDQLGKIIAKLNRREDNDSTGILVTSDHGEMLGDHSMLYKSTFLEGSVRVPLIYRPPMKVATTKLWSNTKMPIGVTETIHFISNNLKEGGGIGRIKSWARQQIGAISEYEEETMFVKGWKKVVYTKNCEQLWSTDLKRDPKENKNIKEQNIIKRSWKLWRVNQWARRELKKRRKTNWQKYWF